MQFAFRYQKMKELHAKLVQNYKEPIDWSRIQLAASTIDVDGLPHQKFTRKTDKLLGYFIEQIFDNIAFYDPVFIAVSR